MKAKITGIWGAALTLLLASLFALSLQTGQTGYANLLMVTPNTFGTPALGTEKLEEFSEEEFLLTYETRQPATVQAVHSSHLVTLVGTNHNYAGIMGYALLNGSFFTKAAMDSKSKHVVLNEPAAFQIFGSSQITGNTLSLNGEAWIVTGVLQDNDTENLNLYAPAGVTGGLAGSIMVLMDKTVTEAYAKNALKNIGIHDNNYDFINLSKLAKAFGERFAVAWKAALSAVILLFILTAAEKLLKKLRLYRDKIRELYLRELLVFYRKDFLKALGGFLAFVAGIAALLTLSLQILGTCLTWQEFMPITGKLTAGDFGQKLLWLREHQLLSTILFWFCILLVLLGLGLVPAMLKGGDKRGKEWGKRKAVALYGKPEPTEFV